MNNNYPEKPQGMKWFHFFYYVRCPFGGLLSLSGAALSLSNASKSAGGLTILYGIIAVLGGLTALLEFIITLIYLKKRYFCLFPQALYYMTLGVLAVECLLSAISYGANPASFIIAISFYVLNFIYFRNRRTYYI